MQRNNRHMEAGRTDRTSRTRYPLLTGSAGATGPSRLPPEARTTLTTRRPRRPPHTWTTVDAVHTVATRIPRTANATLRTLGSLPANIPLLAGGPLRSRYWDERNHRL